MISFTRSRLIRRVYRNAKQWGFDPRATGAALQGYARVHRDALEFRRQRKISSSPNDFPSGENYFVFGEASQPAGVTRGHYFHQDLLVAQAIFRRNPRHHVDVGSRLDGFVAHVASFRKIEVIDIRPHSGPQVKGISFRQLDIMSNEIDSGIKADSVSCLHALEHFGLGRYGDPVDYDGWRSGLQGLKGLLEPGGTLYLSHPTSSRQRVEFNAHRVFSVPFMVRQLTSDFEIERLDFIDDDGDLHADQDPHGSAAASSFGANYGCSVWTLRLGAQR